MAGADLEDWRDSATSQGVPETTRTHTRRGEASPGPPEGAQPCRHLDFSLVTVTSDCWPPELLGNAFLLLQATKCAVICYNSHRRQMHPLLL